MRTNKLALFFVGALLLLPLGPLEAAGSLSVSLNEVGAGTVYPSQWDFEVLDFIITPAGADQLNALTVKNYGSDSYRDLESVTLYQDNGDGIFQGWKKDTDLGKATYYEPLQVWYWQNLTVAVPAAGQRFFVAVEMVRDANIATDRRTLQMGIPAYLDTAGDGVFEPTKDTGIFIASKNNGPTDPVTNAASATVWKISYDYLAPKTLISSPTANQALTSRQVTFSGVDKDQGGGAVASVYVSIKNSSNVYLEQSVLATIIDGQWSLPYTFTADGTYTVISQGKDNGGNLETPGDAVTFTITTAVVAPVVPTTPVLQPLNFSKGDLIKSSGEAIYYYGNDGKRYVFPNLNTYKTWYADFSTVKTISADNLSSITIGGNVTYRPGVKLVKITTDPKVYAVGANGALRWITTEAIAVSLYGVAWSSLVEDVSDAFFVNYVVSTPIYTAADYSPVGVKNAATTISVDKGI